MDELKKSLKTKRLELVKSHVKIAGAKNKNIKIAWKLRKEIAQILTKMNDKTGIKETENK